MTEKKDIQTLLNEAEELLNKCKKNGIQDIFPKEIKVLGKSIKAQFIISCFYIINSKKHNNFNFSGDFEKTSIGIQISKSGASCCDIKVWAIYSLYSLSKEKNFICVPFEDVDKILNNKAIPLAESYVKECQKLIKKQQNK